MENSVIRDIAGAAVRAVARAGGAISITGCEIADSGDGIVSSSLSVTVTGSRIHDVRGRGLELRGVPGTLERSVISAAGTAVALTDGARATLRHVTIHGCATGLLLAEATPGAAGPTANLDSSILWGCGTPLSLGGMSALEANYSDVQDGVLAGVANISADPLLHDPPGADFRLEVRSPCRQTGRDGSDMGAIPYAPTGEIRRYQRCDSNGDGVNDLSDAVHTLLFLFTGGAEASCAIASDCSGDRTIDLSDAIFNLNHLFTGGVSPPGAYPDCEPAELEECAVETCAR